MSARARIDQVRRRLEERVDQAWAVARHRVAPLPRTPEFDGDPRFAVVTVNFSTTHYLKLMLLTLAEQEPLSLVKRIVIVDHDSRDGGVAFVRALAARTNRIAIVESRALHNHGRGMRLGLRALDAIDAHEPPEQRANVVLSIDTDVVFRRRDTLATLAQRFVEGAALTGELRRGVYPMPEAQASFLAVRRDVYGRRDVLPWVNHGAPAYWLQRSSVRAGLVLADFATYRDGYALHRGRAGVRGAQAYAPSSSYASVSDHAPHFMGIANGAALWAEIEAQHAPLLARDTEPALLTHLATRFAPVGRFG